MTPEQKLVVDALSASVAQNRRTLEGLGMMNVAALDEADRMRASMAYAQAQTKLWNSESDLRAALAKTQQDPKDLP